MRLLLPIAVLALGGAGYFYWTQQNSLSPMAQAGEPLTRYEKLSRCAALHGALDDEMERLGKSVFERIGTKAFEEVFLFAARSDQTRGDRSDAAVSSDIDTFKAKYAPHASAYASGDTAGLAAQDLSHCSDLKEVLQ